MVHVEVDRWVGEGMLEEARAALQELRRASSRCEGFLSGSLLRRREDPHHCTAVSQWRSVDDWQGWERSEERRQLNARIAPLLDEPETILILEPL